MTDLDLRQEEDMLNQIKMCLSAFRCMLEDAKQKPGIEHRGLYASSPLTTGRRMFEVLSKRGFKEARELDPVLFRDIIMAPNIDDGVKFGEQLQARGRSNIIVPGAFYAKGWGQEHYMGWWSEVIVRFAYGIAFNTGWQYSNGCVQELLVGLRTGKQLFNAELSPLDLKVACEEIRLAVEEVTTWGFDAKLLYKLYRSIVLELDLTPALANSGGTGS